MSERAAGISVVIPTLNEARSIGQTLDAVLGAPGVAEVIVVDGGSGDGTAEIARRRGAKVVAAGRGRGLQMHAGAEASRGEALWFVHADTLPSADCAGQIAEALADSSVVAGNFDVLFDGRRRAARFLTWLYPRLRMLGLCYGDSAIFVRRESYERVGGFRAYPIFEDLDLVRRLRKSGRVAHLRGVVTTSSRRFEGRSFALTFTRWSLLQLLFWLGVHPGRLGRMYAPVRGADADRAQADAGRDDA